VLNLHHDTTAVGEARLVHLTERRARDGRLVELGEEARHRLLQLGLDAPLDLGERPRRNLILKALELGAELLGEEVRQDGKELADLDEEALELEDGALDALRVLLVNAGELLIAVRAPEEPRLEREPQVAPEHDERRRVRLHEAQVRGRRRPERELAVTRS